MTRPRGDDGRDGPVRRNNLDEAYNSWRDLMLDMAAEERERDPGVPADSITLKVDEFKVFAVEVSGPAGALDQVKKLDSVRLVTDYRQRDRGGMGTSGHSRTSMDPEREGWLDGYPCSIEWYTIRNLFQLQV